MKLPADPTNPYIRHNAQTLTDPNMANQGTVPPREPSAAAEAGRPRAISARSAALTCGISSGRLRNQIQNGTAATTPNAANSQKGVVQVPHRSNSARNRKGPTALRAG